MNNVQITPEERRDVEHINENPPVVSETTLQRVAEYRRRRFAGRPVIFLTREEMEGMRDIIANPPPVTEESRQRYHDVPANWLNTEDNEI